MAKSKSPSKSKSAYAIPWEQSGSLLFRREDLLKTPDLLCKKRLFSAERDGLFRISFNKEILAFSTFLNVLKDLEN